MKKIFFNIILIAGVLLLPQACSDELDVTPTQSVAEEDVFTTTRNAWAAVNGIHRTMFQQAGSMDNAGHGSKMMAIDFMGDDLVPDTWQWFVRAARWQEHDNENASHPYDWWRLYYRIIANANMIIHNIEDAEGPARDREFILGQALAYRAFSYYQMVQFFGHRYDPATTNDQLGVPLVLEPTTEGLPRATVEEVYAQITQDLDQAIGLLEGKVVDWDTDAPKSHITQDVALGLRARVALTMHDWGNAASFANQARQGNVLMSQGQVLQGFSNHDNPEFMWASRQLPDQTTYFHSFYAFMSYNFSSSNIRTCPKAINSQLYYEISDTDIRKQLWEETAEGAEERGGIPGNAVDFHSFKFEAAGSGDSRGDVPFMRTAEMFLIEAEALAQDGQDGQAAQVLYDLVSARDDEYALSANTGQDLIDEIMIHRRVELWGEGHRWFDLKRHNLPLDRTGTNFKPSVVILMEYPADGTLWVSLIPRRELEANSEIVQNVH